MCHIFVAVSKYINFKCLTPVEPVCCKKRQKIAPDQLLVWGVGCRGPLKDLKDSNLILTESKLFPWSSSLVPVSRGPLLSKPVTGQELFLAASFNKPALVHYERKYFLKLTELFKQQSGSLQNNFVFFSSDVDMAIGFMNECQTSGLLNMNTNLLISSVVSLSAVHTDAFSTITIWFGFDQHFSNLITNSSDGFTNFRVPNLLLIFLSNIWYDFVLNL